MYWHDIVSDNSGWVRNSNYDFDEHAKAADYESVGYYIERNKLFLFLAMSVSVDTDTSGMMLAIPIGTIKEIKILGD